MDSEQQTVVQTAECSPMDSEQQKVVQTAECLICYCEPTESNKIKLECKHEYCVECLVKWIFVSISKYCPYCRQVITSTDKSILFGKSMDKDQVVLINKVYYYILDLSNEDFDFFNVCVFGDDYDSPNIQKFTITQESLDRIIQRAHPTFKELLDYRVQKAHRKVYQLKSDLYKPDSTVHCFVLQAY
jgi:hypothetical protein